MCGFCSQLLVDINSVSLLILKCQKYDFNILEYSVHIMLYAS